MRTLLTAGGLSLAFSLFLTPLFVRLCKRLEFGQFIRDDGPKSHHAKRGTPTMGGIIIVLATLFGFFVSALIYHGDGIGAPSLLVLLMLVGMGVVGFVDDFLKTRHQRSLGLGGWAKIFGQVIVATVFALLVLQFPRTAVGAGGKVYTATPASPTVSIVRDQWFNGSVLSFTALFGAVAGVIVFLLWLWLTNLALLFGAELDAELERGRELASGIEAEEQIKLPPRDDRNIEKAEAKEREDVAKGRELRERAQSRDED